MDIGIISLKPARGIIDELSEISRLLDNKIKYGLRFISFEDTFPFDACGELKKINMSPILTWEFYFPSVDGPNRRECSREETHLTDLLNGNYDGYIKSFAVDAKRWGDIVWLRPFHEFNAGWYVWGGEKNGGPDGGPDLVKRCWIHIANIFRETGAQNVRWIWCPHEPSFDVSPCEWNNIKNYWPGSEYVDLLGIAGFNFYPENPEREDPEFQSFESLFSGMYSQVAALSDKPVFIMTGTAEFARPGKISSKADWIIDAFVKIRNDYPRITAAGWFHYRFCDNADWRINSSKNSLRAFKVSLV